MIRAILWKEWHENRSRYIAYWLTINAPILLLALAMGLSKGARVPFADLSDALALKYLPLALLEPIVVMTVFLLVTGYLAVATFSPEIEDHSLFFVYEQGISRRQYFAIKLLNGAAHVVLATVCAVMLLPLTAFVIMLASGKVSLAGSGQALSLVMSVAARAAVWSALISLGAFTACTVVSLLIPKWRWAALCSSILTALFVGYGTDYFSFLPDMPDNSMSIGFNLSTSGGQWITISRPFTPAELNAIALWWPVPLIIAILLIAAFCTATALLYDRKEMV
jgi:hypothetical protein